VNLREDPFVTRGLASGCFDDDGVATQARDVVKDGVLQGYFLGVYSARKLGMKSTQRRRNANLILAPGRATSPACCASSAPASSSPS